LEDGMTTLGMTLDLSVITDVTHVLQRTWD